MDLFGDFASGVQLWCYRSDDLARRHGAEVQGDVLTGRDVLAQGSTSQSRNPLRNNVNFKRYTPLFLSLCLIVKAPVNQTVNILR